MPRLTHTNPWQGKKVLLPPRPPLQKKMLCLARPTGRVGELLAKVRHVLRGGRWVGRGLARGSSPELIKPPQFHRRDYSDRRRQQRRSTQGDSRGPTSSQPSTRARHCIPLVPYTASYSCRTLHRHLPSPDLERRMTYGKKIELGRALPLAAVLNVPAEERSQPVAATAVPWLT